MADGFSSDNATRGRGDKLGADSGVGVLGLEVVEQLEDGELRDRPLIFEQKKFVRNTHAFYIVKRHQIQWDGIGKHCHFHRKSNFYYPATLLTQTASNEELC